MFIVNFYIIFIKTLQGRRDTIFSGKRNILPSGNDNFLWESDHLSSGIWDILWETGHAILCDSNHLTSGKHPLGIGNLGDEVQPSLVPF